jgi:flagellar FliJ protein
MKRFRFPLERVLEYRREMELERRRALGVAMTVLTRREEEQRALAGDVSAYRTELARLGTGKISSRELALYRSYLTHLEMRLAKAAQWTRDARVAVEGRRRELVAASRETKVLDKLKARDLARYEYAAGRDETGVLDEIATTRFIADAAAAQETP